ncbi:FAD-binding oxidoreductase [Lutibacter sp. HS1-25]|uniref:NAD(P)/FAD-dependent oxidoreductase n=1 Tax=Lutibacter sp. HS1-25 TaxID=2485000 RepID=UPI001010A2C9|nr:FAD-binding oxidoreductase [Lutibacter sp. HS1-25]RXP54125.1 FAD-binding oxidoreductase [Lutibacter sp. HS1-25]
MKVDYIVVGLGLAGIAFTKKLEDNNKSFLVFEDHSQNSSIVAGGMYNPVILKRFTPVWSATSQLEIALPFYEELSNKFNSKYDYKVDIYRIFKSIEEQNDWFVASDKSLLSNYMVPQIVNQKYHGIKAEYGYGKLFNTGRVDTKLLLNNYHQYLLNKGLIKNESFNYNALTLNEDTVEYQGIHASKIVFCEGFGLQKNPFFNYLPMQEAKGELLIIHAPALNVDFLIKAAVFVLPLGENLYKVGATFNWKDKTKLPSEEGKQELIDKLNSFITVPYTIVEHIAGIRPTVKDRRPLVGKHPKHQNMAILNGLGTRGVMIAPTAAIALYDLLEHNIELDPEIAIDRFQ